VSIARQFRSVVLPALLLVWTALRCRAEGVDFEGITLAPPLGWGEPQLAEGAPGGRSLLWAGLAASGGSRIVFSLSASRSTLAGAGFGSCRAGLERLERELRLQAELGGFQVRDLRRLTIDGLPAWRLRTRVELSGDRIEQLHYLIAGGRTYVLSFSASEQDFDREEAGFETLARAASVTRRPGSLRAGAPLWLGFGLCGGLAFLLLELRRGRGATRTPQERGTQTSQICADGSIVFLASAAQPAAMPVYGKRFCSR
jgi:hypothetical protein